ncbi:MAG: glycine cleavage system protein R [Gammaproteobacteria bacterium]|nr:glycine cleavage system protein R [Gammaproteobacteria bacterium]
MSNYLVISAVGEDRPGLVADLTQIIVNCGCNIEESRMSLLGGEFAVLMMVSGPWNSIAKLEDALPSSASKLGINTAQKRTQARALTQERLPYNVEVVSLDHPGIVQQLASFFSKRQINIHDMYTTSHRAAHTGSTMFSLSMTIEIPAGTHITTLREQFMEFCDHLNLDAILEPVKG